jgi:phage-related protein
MREIIFYLTDSGNCPVKEFLDSLTGKQAQKVAWVLKVVEELEMIPTQYMKKLVGTDDIWEIRVQYANDIIRILSFFNGGNLVVLNHGFFKKTQKTPKQDIIISEKRKKDYLRRKHNE